ncbi:hypothetical protein [Kitasatospora sp. NPDC089509]
MISLDPRWQGRSDRPAWGQRIARRGKDAVSARLVAFAASL